MDKREQHEIIKLFDDIYDSGFLELLAKHIDTIYFKWEKTHSLSLIETEFLKYVCAFKKNYDKIKK